jgi:gas vesicle protein
MKTQTHEFKQEKHRVRPVKSVLGGFLVGSAIGVATALLFAPRSGEETRAEIRDKAVELRDRTTETVRDTVSQAKSKASEIKDNVVEKAEELTQRGKHTMNRQVDRASEAVETGREKIQEY